MNTRQKALRTGAIFIAVLIVAGLLLLYKGNDAVAIGMEKKEGILTAEQVKMSFDSVSGRLLKEAVKEGDTVKAGQPLISFDRDAIAAAGHEDVVACVVSNPDAFQKIEHVGDSNTLLGGRPLVKLGDPLLVVRR